MTRHQVAKFLVWMARPGGDYRPMTPLEDMARRFTIKTADDAIRYVCPKEVVRTIQLYAPRFTDAELHTLRRSIGRARLTRSQLLQIQGKV